MNLTELKTFLAIVDTGSLVQASARENVSQSTVTARLKALEQELGQTLITRQKSGASLTPAGMRLLRYAETIRDLWQQARQETSLPDGVVDACNMACATDLWPDLGARLFDYIRATQPRTALSIWTGGQHDVSQWLDGGRIDFALSYWRTGSDARLIGTDELILVADRADRPIRFDPGYVYIENGEDFGKAHAIAYSDADTATLSFGTAELGLAHILSLGGSAYAPKRLAAPHLRTGRLFHLAEAPTFRRDIYLVGRSDTLTGWDWLEPAIKATL